MLKSTNPHSMLSPTAAEPSASLNESPWVSWFSYFSPRFFSCFPSVSDPCFDALTTWLSVENKRGAAWRVIKTNDSERNCVNDLIWFLYSVMLLKFGALMTALRANVANGRSKFIAIAKQTKKSWIFKVKTAPDGTWLPGQRAKSPQSARRHDFADT